ncbi:hypothetical protein EUX98_g8967 [Antrodiella citrinella]|uniref:Uncharacterized protein n=1 Tax=Antrodiella citrinella TaxID=2447956 RepID=A0A4S4M066_9APHY|nr:hypothetical protein EUX98_g8967 [Antrodiella citrinella]
MFEFLLPPQQIRIVNILYSGPRTSVYLGLCEDEREVALKFTDPHAVLVEAGAYDSLVAIQGSVLPKLYGVLHGEDWRGDKMSCLVLERFGEQLDCGFLDLRKSEKAKILNKLAEAHRAGLHHLDFAERNVLVKGGDYRIIDLGHAKPHNPPCQWTYDFLEHVECDDVNITDPSVRCSVLKSWADEMEFWDHGKLLLCRTMLVPKSDKLPPQAIINCLNTAIGIDVKNHYVFKDKRQIAIRYFEYIQKQLQNGRSLEQLKKDREWIAYLVHKQWHEERKETFRPIPSLDFSSRASRSDESDDSL